MDYQLRELWLDKPGLPMGNALYIIAVFPRRRPIAFHVGTLKSVTVDKKILDDGRAVDIQCIDIGRLRDRVCNQQENGSKGKWNLLLQALDAIGEKT